ncbi:unnamed protein product [Rotaria sp. Silwood1]|nr:unnamed protein product [Rotaria sp. Silwood1]
MFCSSNDLLNGQYNTYDDDDCLDFYANEDITSYNPELEQSYRMEHQIVSFCQCDNFQEGSFTIDRDIPALTFHDLHQRNITGVQLYSWSAHLDVIEEYEAFRQNFIDDRITASLSIFYNCSSKHKFGQFCQYSVDSQVPFDRLVKEVLTKTHPVSSSTTCYLHLNCTRDQMSWCLDWREICDGKVDCWPIPVDEQNCEKLKENEYGPNEYRCFNGQCIPDTFLSDNVFTPDCLDRTDEDSLEGTLYPKNCDKGDPAFRCTDITYPYWTHSSLSCCNPSCGRDSCRAHLFETFEHNLLSYNANTHITEECWVVMICLAQATRRISFVRMLKS